MITFGHAGIPITRQVAESRTVAVISRLIGLLLFTAGHLWAAGPRPGFQVLDVIVDEQILNEICSQLTLDDERRAAIQESFHSYFSTIQKLDASTYAAVLDAGYRQILEADAQMQERVRSARQEGGRTAAREVLDSGQFQIEELFAKLEPRIVQAQMQGWQQADSILLGWLADLSETASLEVAQASAIDRLVRRRNVFSPETGQVDSGPDYWVAMDLEALVKQASADDSELCAIAGTCQTPQDEEFANHTITIDQARTELAHIMSDWEMRLDERLKELIALGRSTIRERGGADPDEARSRHVSTWVRNWTVFSIASNQICDVLMRRGDLAARDRWQSRVDRALCPQLTAERLPNRLVEWLSSQPEHTAEQLASATLIQQEYRNLRRPLIRAAIDHGLVLQHHFESPSGTSPVQLQFAKDQLAICDLGARSIRQFRAILNSDQSQALNESLRREGRAAIGPTIAVEPLEALGETDRYKQEFAW